MCIHIGAILFNTATITQEKWYRAASWHNRASAIAIEKGDARPNLLSETLQSLP